MQLWSLVGLRSREGIPTCEPETQMDQAYISLLTEKNNLLIAVDQLEHSFATRELKLKDLIRRNSENATRRLNLYANLCISSISVAVTVFALMVVMLLK